MSSIVEEIRAEVEEEALAKGRMEGRAELQTAIALQMLQMGEFSLEKIAEITRLSLDEVRALAEAPPR